MDIESALQMAREDLARELDNMIPVNTTRDALAALVHEIYRLRQLVGAASGGPDFTDIKAGFNKRDLPASNS